MSGGSIEVHRPEKCRELDLFGQEFEGREDGLDLSSVRPASRVVVSSPQRTGSQDMGRPVSREIGRLSRTVSRDTGRLSRLSSAAQMANVQLWLTQKACRAVVALSEPAEAREVEWLCQALLKEEEELIAELESTVHSQASEAVCKREMLYHKWSSRVFAPLHTHVAMVMGGRRYQVLEARKRELFEQYLSYSNRKSVFLETVSADEYNPLSLSDRSTQLTAVTGRVDDPLLTQQTDRATEQHIISASSAERCGPEGCGLKRCGTERGLDAVHWLAIQLVYVDSSVRKRSQLCVGRDHNEMQGEGGDLKLPHKTPATLPHKPLTLTWPLS